MWYSLNMMQQSIAMKPAEWIRYIAIYLGLPSECRYMACRLTSDIFTKECQHYWTPTILWNRGHPAHYAFLAFEREFFALPNTPTAPQQQAWQLTASETPSLQLSSLLRHILSSVQCSLKQQIHLSTQCTGWIFRHASVSGTYPCKSVRIWPCWTE